VHLGESITWASEGIAGGMGRGVQKSKAEIWLHHKDGSCCWTLHARMDGYSA